MKKALLTAAIASSVAPLHALAQTPQDTMVVVGSRSPQSISEVPGAVWVVEHQQLQDQLNTGQSLKSALGKLIPGFDIGSSTNRTNYAQNFRGRDALVMIDGVSMNGSRSLSRQFDAIDPFNIERIEVLSGASSLYGGGATGGIINIITKDGEPGGPHLESEVGLATGFNDSNELQKRAAQAMAFGNERVNGRVSAAVQQNGWFYDGDGEIIKPDIAQSGLQGNRTLDVMGSLDVALTEHQHLDLLAQKYRSRFEGDKGLVYPDYNTGSSYTAQIQGSEVRDGYASDVDPETDRTLFNANYRHDALLGQQFYFQAFHRQESSVFNPFPGGGNAFTVSEQNTDLSGAKAMFSAQLAAPLSLTYGIDFSHETFDSRRFTLVSDDGGRTLDKVDTLDPYYPSFQADTLAGFAQAEYQATDALLLSGGVRVEQTDVEVDPQGGNDGGSNDYDVSLFNAKALYDFHNGHQAWLAYSQGFEIPDIAKSYRNVSFDISDNPVDGIKTQQVEAGWRMNAADWNTQIAAYYSWSDKALDYVYSDGGLEIGTTTIDRDVRTYGIEGKVQRYLGRHVDVGTSFHWSRSEVEQDGEWLDASVTEASMPKAVAFANWADDDTRAMLQVNRTFDIDDADGNALDGFTTVDTGLSQDTGVGTFSLGVDNLLDEQYTTTWGQRAAIFYEAYGASSLWDLNGQGRTFRLTWSLDV